MSGFSHNDFLLQIEALDFVLHELAPRLKKKAFALGGGTALALFYFEHRRSFDLDFFIYDYEAMPFVAAKMYIDDYDFLAKEYTDMAEHVRLSTISGVKIDFLYSQNLTGDTLQPKSLKNLTVAVESIFEIIAKKIHYRGKNLKARDIFDIAVALEKEENLLDKLLKSKALQIDDLFNLHNGVSTLSAAKYANEMRFTEPYDNYKEISHNAVDIILSHLDKAKREFLNSF